MFVQFAYTPEIVNPSNFLIFAKLKAGGGVYIYIYIYIFMVSKENLQGWGCENAE